MNWISMKILDYMAVKYLHPSERDVYEFLKTEMEQVKDGLTENEKRLVQVKRETLKNMLIDSIMSYIYRFPMNKNHMKLAQKVTTVTQMASLFIHKFKYTYDKPGEDYWQTPAETWNRRDRKGKILGDCDDYARFAAWVFNINGYDAKILVMYGNKAAHATCLVKFPDEYVTIGTFYRVHHKTLNLKEVITFWYKDWKHIIGYSQDKDTFELKVSQTIEQG